MIYHKVILGTALVALLSGCVSTGEIIRYGAKVNDDALKSAEFTICQGASIGSIRRNYNTPEKIYAWKSLCQEPLRYEPPVGEVK